MTTTILPSPPPKKRKRKLAAPPLPEGWFVAKVHRKFADIRGQWVLYYDCDGIAGAVLSTEEPSRGECWIAQLDGCQNIAPLSAVKAFVWVVENDGHPDAKSQAHFDNTLKQRLGGLASWDNTLKGTT
jgi:hypothetical protein